MPEEGRESAGIVSKLFPLIDPIRAQNADFLRELESRFSAWSTQLEGPSGEKGGQSHGTDSVSSGAMLIRVGDMFVTNLKMLQVCRFFRVILTFFSKTVLLCLFLMIYEIVQHTRNDFERDHVNHLMSLRID